MTVRNICYSELPQRLANKYNVLISSPYAKALKSFETLKHPNISIISCPVFGKLDGRAKRFRNILYFGLWQLKHPATMEKYISETKSSQFLKYLIFNILAGFYTLIANFFKKGDWLRDFIFFFNINKFINQKVDCVLAFSTNMPQDQSYLYSAMRLRIYTIAMPHSWDNLPSRGLMPFVPDQLLVWNRHMKEQALEFHDFNNDSVHIVGCLQYETYKKQFVPYKKEDFILSLGISKDAKIILYTSTSKRTFPDEPAFIERLVGLCNSDLFGENVHLIIRLIPSEFLESYLNNYRDNERITIQVVGKEFQATTVSPKFDSREMFLFTNTIKHSDVVINLASTITIDASFFDRPIVNIGYNMNTVLSQWNHASKWYDSSHFREIKRVGGYYYCKSEEELINGIQKSLGFPHEHKKQRLKITEDNIGPENPSSNIFEILRTYL